jgi:hypothetical protein
MISQFVLRQPRSAMTGALFFGTSDTRSARRPAAPALAQRAEEIVRSRFRRAGIQPVSKKDGSRLCGITLRSIPPAGMTIFQAHIGRTPNNKNTGVEAGVFVFKP